MTVSLVTGASSGIGRSLARRIAAEGHAVAVVARRRALLDTLVGEIEAAGGRALAIQCDVTDPGRVRDAVRETERTLGPIDRLVANAGGGERTSVDPFDAAHVERVLALNVIGTANCIEAVLPGMIARRAGHIVAVSSLAAYRGLPGAAAYCAAKAALTAMMESLMLDLRPFGVGVTIVLPGFVRTKPASEPRKRRRPGELDLEEATARIHRAIVARRRRDAFPFGLAAAAGIVRLLPAGLYARMLAGRGRKAGKDIR
ncbi:MAG: SDR family NAD(P)-dependent oxidoreductase [Rhodospirillales bacterium]